MWSSPTPFDFFSYGTSGGAGFFPQPSRSGNTSTGVPENVLFLPEYVSFLPPPSPSRASVRAHPAAPEKTFVNWFRPPLTSATASLTSPLCSPRFRPCVVKPSWTPSMPSSFEPPFSFLFTSRTEARCTALTASSNFLSILVLLFCFAPEPAHNVPAALATCSSASLEPPHPLFRQLGPCFSFRKEGPF